ncbi:MAG: tetratricopeptide repeat protein [bacterium]|nr:tetratricopeptide repeat protein [bacterium]MDI1337465.1 tetratricopeptide repeat protein [Lacunisphaera sp.]
MWLAAVLGAWLFVKYYRHIPAVRYADLLLPTRWPAYRTSEGNYYIAHAADLLKKGEANAALYQLRAGLAKAPANAGGRTTLAGLYLALRRPDLARDLLLDGLRYLPDDPAYLQATLSFLLEFQEDAKLLEVAGQQLDSPRRAAIHPVAAIYAATAAYYRGNYDRAEDLIMQYRLRDTAEGATLLARIEWERGYPELALLRLDALLALQPGHDGARALLASYYRALGRTSALESAIVERLVSDPLAPAPRIEYLRLHAQRGDRAKLDRDLETYLSQFQHDPTALLLLADFAAATGRPALARRVQQIFSDRPENNGAPALMVAEAHIVAGEYQAALGLITDYARDYPEWASQFASVFNGLQAVALYGLGKKDEARLPLDHLLAQKNLRADHLVAVSNRLAALGARDLALAALGRAVEADPLNQAALTNLLRLELDTGSLAALPAHLARFLHTRQPSREILARAYATLGSDRYLFFPPQAGQLAALRTALASNRP